MNKDIITELELDNCKPAFIIGKGPTYKKVKPFLERVRRDFLLVGINEVCIHMPVDIAICSHIEPAFQVLKRGKYKHLVMPTYPVIGIDQKTIRPIEDFPEFKDAYAWNCYWVPDKKRPIIAGQANTSHYAFLILRAKGFTEFFFAGIDGGWQKKTNAPNKRYYADEFDLHPLEYWRKHGGEKADNYDQRLLWFFERRRAKDENGELLYPNFTMTFI